MKEAGVSACSCVEGITVAGKTGTAQNPHGEDHAWFIAFAPVEDPRITVTVLVENGGHGSSVAAPIAQKVLSTYFELFPPKRDPENVVATRMEKSTGPSLPPPGESLLPSN